VFGTTQKKKAVGTYFSTKIFQFRMRCHLCSGWIEIHTDPENCTYVVVSGGRRKVETWEPTPDDHIIKLKDEETAKKLAEDPFYKLEYATEDKRKAQEDVPVLDRLQKINESLYDDFTMSQKMRKRFRDETKAIAEAEQQNALKGLPPTLKLLPPSEEDELEAKKFIGKHPTLKAVEDKKVKDRVLIKTASIFGATSESSKKEHELKVQAALKRKRLDPSLLKRTSSTGTSLSKSLFK